MKKFILKVKHNLGTSISIVNTPSLEEALELYKNKIKGVYGKDKGTIVPHIHYAEINEVNYDLT